MELIDFLIENKEQISVQYYWYDHLVRIKHPEIVEEISSSIANHNWEVFNKYFSQKDNIVTLPDTLYVYINGIEEQAGDLVTGIELESRVVTHIKFDIECTAYTSIKYVFDKNKVAIDNLWKNVKELEYSTISDVNDKIDYAINVQIDYCLATFVGE